MIEIDNLPTCILCGEKFKYKAEDTTMGYCNCEFIMDYYSTVCPICFSEQYILTYLTSYDFKRVLICKNINCSSLDITIEICKNFKKSCHPRLDHCNGKVVKFKDFYLTMNLERILSNDSKCFTNFKIKLGNKIVDIFNSKLITLTKFSK